MKRGIEHPNFLDDEGNAYLVKCPKCDKENYAMNVATGICTWCGYDLNDDTNPEQIKKHI